MFIFARDLYVICTWFGNHLVSLTSKTHCMKSVGIWNFSGPYFPAFRLNFPVQFECGKIQTRKTPNTDTFYVVTYSKLGGGGKRGCSSIFHTQEDACSFVRL